MERALEQIILFFFLQIHLILSKPNQLYFILFFWSLLTKLDYEQISLVEEAKKNELRLHAKSLTTISKQSSSNKGLCLYKKEETK